MKVLITGGAGFIGSHLTDKLIEKGCSVVVVDNLSTGKKENLDPKAKFYKLDICSPKIKDIFQKEKPEIVFHYAAQLDVKKSMENPAEDAKVNILGSLNLLESCRKYKVKRIIFASSIGVYGEPQKLPVKENHPLNPISPYPIAKLSLEKYLYYYQKQGLNFISLRYANVYGPRQSGSGEGGVVAIFINKILKGDRPIIFGSGQQTRDFLYVDDAVKAAISALKARPGFAYNVGTNKEITINGLFKLILKTLGRQVEPIFKPAQPGEILKSKIDYAKIKKELGWQPDYELEKGLAKTINWLANKNF